MSTPALRALRAARPEAQICGVLRAHLAGALRGHPALDELVEHEIYAARTLLGQTRRRWAVARRLRGADLVLVLPNSIAGAVLAWATRAPRRVGYARRGRSILLTDAVPAPRQRGRFVPLAMERYYLDLVRYLGGADQGTDLELATEPDVERSCEELFAEHGLAADVPIVGFAPGAGFGPSKIWPLEYVAEVARALIDDGMQVALLHGPGEEPLAQEIIDTTQRPIASLGGAGLDLSLLKSTMSRMSLLICNDAGSRHVAAAFGVPTLVLMGPTSIQYTNLNLGKTKLLREPVECSPCHLKVCPIDHRCMTRLKPERVLAEARAALTQPDWRGSVDLELRA